MDKKLRIGDRVTVVQEWASDAVGPHTEVADGLPGTLLIGSIGGYPYRVDLDSPLIDGRQRIYVRSVRKLKKKDDSKRTPKLGLQQILTDPKVGDRVTIVNTCKPGGGCVQLGHPYDGKSGVLVATDGSTYQDRKYLVQYDEAGFRLYVHSVKPEPKPENEMAAVSEEPTGHQHWPGCHLANYFESEG